MSKPKKEKVTWVDDGRTVADMSGLPESPLRRLTAPGTSTGSFKEKWATYWGATKMMLLPMLAVCAGIGLIYLLMLLLFSVL